MLRRCATVDYRNVCDTLQPEVDLIQSWPWFCRNFREIVSIRVKTLSKTNFVACESIQLPEIRLRLAGYKFCTNFVASRRIKGGNASLPVCVPHSEVPFGHLEVRFD